MRNYKSNGYTKKHFEQWAAILKDMYEKELQGIKVTDVDQLVSVFVRVFTYDNANFNTRKFVLACGFNPDSHIY
jgi:hypothetical protein